MSLAQQQAQLLQALWQPRHIDALQWTAEHGLLSPGAGGDRGLKAYRSQAQTLAVRALGAAYPVVAQLLGEENFEPLARHLWQQHPPSRGDVAQWGGQLPTHIESLAELAAEEPYLADVARAEWALHAIATAADARPDPESFPLLAQRDPAAITLVLSPGAVCMASAYPVVSIVLAHVEGEPTLAQAGERLRAGTPETALVWRQGLKPRLRQALADEAAFLGMLQEHCSLLDSLQGAPNFPFNVWLSTAVQGGLLVAVREC